MPRLESLAVVKGEHVCTNEDIIRNAAYSWSPMTADDIEDKTGIRERRYTERRLEHISLQAAHAALEGAGRRPEEIGAVIFCSCTTTTLIPSVATWLSGQLGIFQTHGSFDLIAACAGFPYGLAEAVRLLQEVRRPVLVVCAEKFSDKIGSVRPSRMIFGDGASALVVGPAADGAPPDIEVLQAYASGPVSQVNSIIWPNPEFDNNLTVYGPEVKALVERYLEQMMGELRALDAPDGGSLLDAIDLVVPHQANKSMVAKSATAAGLDGDDLYFDVETVGNVSAASIPIAIYDAVREGAIDRPMRVFTPAFGAGAVGGYTVIRVDPAIVVPEGAERGGAADGSGRRRRRIAGGRPRRVRGLRPCIDPACRTARRGTARPGRVSMASTEANGRATTDIDAEETREWLESLDSVLRNDGADRARFLLERLVAQAGRVGASPPLGGTTPYVNTIPVDQEPEYPGDEAIERRIRTLIRWNAMATVLEANKESSELGGHIASYQSAATLYEVGFNHFWHAPSDEHGGDLVFMQGHCAPGFYARAFLEGRAERGPAARASGRRSARTAASTAPASPPIRTRG